MNDYFTAQKNLSTDKKILMFTDKKNITYWQENIF